MSDQTIDYPKLVEHALRHVVRDTLTLIAEHGLPGRHNIYITFLIEHPGVALADELRARYPTEMTIVLQHEFWGLEVGDEGFGVTLSFNNVPQRIEIPFEAITVFADPSVEFGLQFNLTAQGQDGEEEETDEDDAVDGEVTTMPQPEVGNEAKAKSVEDVKEGDGAEVVTLDQFRKKS
ncbi:MAG: ClpXP protease specificity-enhancing factor SspB [Alphaproteobacteria bacterium]|nr:ClpXP protease specificity-enhancing factor SspB [Alphaproteobacteria bacterium]